MWPQSLKTVIRNIYILNIGRVNSYVVFRADNLHIKGTRKEFGVRKKHFSTTTQYNKMLKKSKMIADTLKFEFHSKGNW